MLVTTQLLAGSGGSVYLCISDNGSFCCIDAGPSTCTCGVKQNATPTELDEEACDCSCSCHNSDPCDECDDGPMTRLSSSGDPSGCTHLLLSHNQAPASVARTSSATVIDRLLHIAAHTSGMTAMYRSVDCQDSPHARFRPPAVTSQAITVLSWVLIQC